VHFTHPSILNAFHDRTERIGVSEAEALLCELRIKALSDQNRGADPFDAVATSGNLRKCFRFEDIEREVSKRRPYADVAAVGNIVGAAFLKYDRPSVQGWIPVEWARVIFKEALGDVGPDPPCASCYAPRAKWESMTFSQLREYISLDYASLASIQALAGSICHQCLYRKIGELKWLKQSRKRLSALRAILRNKNSGHARSQ
jgi:hypothetical protein